MDVENFPNHHKLLCFSLLLLILFVTAVYFLFYCDYTIIVILIKFLCIVIMPEILPNNQTVSYSVNSTIFA